MATKDTVLDHLRALGYLDTSMNSLVSESFIRECVEELNAEGTTQYTHSHSHDNDSLLIRDHLERREEQYESNKTDDSFDLDRLEQSLFEKYDDIISRSSSPTKSPNRPTSELDTNKDYDLSVEHEDTMSAFITSLSNRKPQTTVLDEGSFSRVYE
ncbi:UNVERIFIED_CONTAM: hypothetical protein HDU68_008566, partial [Siphonaria sp. JEL0065]